MYKDNKAVRAINISIIKQLEKTRRNNKHDRGTQTKESH